MNRELYDFTIPPDVPQKAHTTMYYFPHQHKSSLGLQPLAPAYNDPPCMAAHYNEAGELLGVRFIFKDGTWRDA